MNRNFERLNDEKITPYFMSLAKQSCTDALLSDIRNNNGGDFIDCSEREKYIVEYYKDLYKAKVNDNIGVNSINDFLGDVATHPDVISSKLTENEKLDLERPLSLAELDSSAKKGKLNTAPGIDGMTNKFILNFWEYFRSPLYKYTLACYNSGSLTDNFRSAKIRLIPKKGDLPPLPVEVSTRPFKVFAYADDANMLVKLDVPSLTRLRTILDDFGTLSGLECNVEKTTLLQVGVESGDRCPGLLCRRNGNNTWP
jgi:hypothetical protein